MIIALASLIALTTPSPGLRFDGRTAMTVPDNPALNVKDAVTIEAWVWPGRKTGDNAFTYIVSRNMNNTGYGLVTIGHDTKRLQGTGWGLALEKPGDPIKVGRWSHVAFVRTAKGAKLFVNGRLIAKHHEPADFIPNHLQLYVGCSPFANGSEPCGWVGALKDVRVWNVARSARAIRRSMNRRLSGRERGLVCYLPMNEGKGQMAHDKTGKTPGGCLGDTFEEDGNDPTWVRW